MYHLGRGREKSRRSPEENRLAISLNNNNLNNEQRSPNSISRQMIIPKPFSSKQLSYLSFYCSGRRSHPNTLTLVTLLKRGFNPTLNTFNQFLLFLYGNQRFKSVVQFFHQMNLNQIDGDSGTRSIYMKALVKEQKFEEAMDFLKTQMRKDSIFLQNRIWDYLIQGLCVDEKDPEKGLSALRDCLRINGILPSSFTFYSLLHSFSSQGKMDGALQVIELMNDEKIKYLIDNFVCSSMISGFVKIGEPALAVRFFEDAEKSGALRPNVVTCTALMTAYYELGEIEYVSDFVSRMEKDGLSFDTVFYSSWILEYFREGIIEEVLKKYREMVERKLELDTTSYTILIDGFSKEGNVEKAVGFLHKMKKDGIEPNLVTYTAIMLGFCKKGKLEEAYVILKMAEDIGIKLDEFAYAILIDGVCRRGNFDLVFYLLEKMEREGIKPSIVTYNTVINGLCKAGRTSEADEISKDILGDTVTYSTLLHGYIEENNAMGMLEIRKRLEVAGISIDVVMCNILIKAFFMLGLFEDALATYKGMPDMNLVPDSVTYYTMISGYCKVDQIDEALEIFDEFRRTCLSSAACYNCIIDGLCRLGLVRMAVDVFVELNEKGLPLDVGMWKMLLKVVIKESGADGIFNLILEIQNLRPETFCVIYNDAICFLCKEGFLEAAFDVYLLIWTKGFNIESKSYYSILEALINDEKDWLTHPVLISFLKSYGLAHPSVSKILTEYMCAKDVNNALKYFKMMNENNRRVTLSVTILQKLTRAGRVLDAYKLVTEANGNVLLMDVVDYSIIIDGLCKGGHIEKALDLCDFARKNGITLSTITYNSVINGLCSQGCLVEAFRLFDSMEKLKVVPSEITYATLIDALSKGAYLLDARKLYERMIHNGLKPNTRVYNSLINGYCNSGLMPEVLKLLLDLESKGLIPDDFTVSVVIKGYCQKGDMEGGLGFHSELKRKGILPDFMGFLYLIRGLCAKGRMEESRTILREMLQVKSVVDLLKKAGDDFEMESIASALIFLCEQGSIQEAISILNKVGLIFFPVTRISGVCHGSERGEKLFDGKVLSTDKLKSEVTTYTTYSKFDSYHVRKLGHLVKNCSNIDRGSLSNDFNSFYAHIASHCSQGELVEASNMVRWWFDFG